MLSPEKFNEAIWFMLLATVAVPLLTAFLCRGIRRIEESHDEGDRQDRMMRERYYAEHGTHYEDRDIFHEVSGK